MNSWDCFDTLIARAYKDPISIFNSVSSKINDTSFTQKRIQAEKLSKYKTYEDIYSHLPNYDPNIELETEKQYSFPIIENWNRIKNGDIIISDMYLSSLQIRNLLEYHGFNKDVEIFVTYGGKHSGESWKYLLNKHPNIKNHYGDNIKSDVLVSRSCGIKAVFSPLSLFTPDEKDIATFDYTLATLMRRTRLSNPYSKLNSIYIHNKGSFQNVAGHIWSEEIDGFINYFKVLLYETQKYIILKNLYHSVYIKIYFNSGECFYSENNKEYIKAYDGFWLEEETSNNQTDYQKLIWSDQSQFNIPILILVSLALPNNKPILFSQRDCIYLYKIYQALTNNHDAEMLEVSRKGYYEPFSIDYANYIIDKTKNALIVDSHGSGSSANSFFNSRNLQFDLYHICKHLTPRGTVDTNNMKWTSTCNRSFNCPGRFFEKHNISYNGPLVGWLNDRAIRANPEHDKTVCDTISRCIDSTIEYINIYNVSENTKIIPKLLEKLRNTFTEQFVQSIGK